MVAPSKAFTKDPVPEIKETGSNWIALIPYAFTSHGKAEVRYNENKWQWWGEQPEGIRESIRLAKAQGLKIMLKPQVYIHRGWVGNLDFHSEKEWIMWEEQYKRYLMIFVQIAIDEHVEMICIGTEIYLSATKRATFWIELIADIRKVYHGKLTFSANWDHYRNIPFWNQLDYIGISAYFPLLEDKQPEKDKLMNAWKPYTVEMKEFSKNLHKKILFTEFGYLCVDGCAGKTWELEMNIASHPINQTAQATSLDALLETFMKETFWAGGFLWKWFPNMDGHEGYPERDYTPQGKAAEFILKKWYSK